MENASKALIIAGSILGGLILITLIVFFIIPKITGGREITIPDVSKMSVEKAKETLKDEGLKVDSKQKKEYSDEVKKGKVINTSPGKGKSIKKGTKVKLIVSKGEESVKVKDYTGTDYKKLKKKLEKKGIIVEIKEEEHSTDDNLEEGTIIEQSIKEGEKIKKGDTIVLTVVKMVTVYPDFVNEGYTLEKVQAFCDKNNITLETIEKETNDAKEGSIIYQNRTAGSKVVSGVTLKVTVAKKIPEVAVNSITLNRGDQSLVVGDTVTIGATINPSNATDKTLTWKSSNTGVATVNNGTIVAKGKGTATITVTSSNGKSNSIVVEVKEADSE